MKKYLFGVIAILIIALFGSIRSCQSNVAEKKRLSDNQRSLLSNIDFYRTKDSLSAASVERLTITNSELKKYCTDLVKTIEELGIKVKRLQSASTTAIASNYNISAPVTPRKIVFDDELFKTASKEAMIETLNKTSAKRNLIYKTPYIDITGILSDDSINMNIQTFDTIVQVVHRVPRKFLFVRYGTKAIRQEVVSKNPHSQITYTEYIELKK